MKYRQITILAADLPDGKPLKNGEEGNNIYIAG
jgi:hypothetical protein